MSKKEKEIINKEVEEKTLPAADADVCMDMLQDSPDVETLMLQNIVQLNVDKAAKCALDFDSFQDGIKDVSRICGSITALVNVGIPPLAALSYLMDDKGASKMLANNLEVAKINADSNVESAKYGQAYLSKMTL